jgi:hypothetical protein
MPNSKSDHVTSHVGPVFIVGMNGSGTTMLADCLDNSAELYVFPWETQIIPWFAVNVRTFGDLTDRGNLERLYLKFKGSAEFKRKSLQEQSQFSDVAEPSLFGVIDAVYASLAQRKKGTRRWLEKSPMNVQFMPEILEQIPTARFIHIMRDGRDVALSNERRFGWNREASVQRWVLVVRKGREDGLKLGSSHYLELKYEDLTADPERSMKEVCDFIGISYHDELLRSGMPWLQGPGRNAMDQKAGTIVHNSQKWKSALGPDAIASMDRWAGKLLDELGYETALPSSELLPGRFRLAFWTAQGFLSRVSYQWTAGHFLRNPGRLAQSYLEKIRYWRQLRDR